MFEELRALAARNVSAEDEVVVPRRRDVRPLRAGAGRLDHHALGVPHAVYAVPARDLAGRAAGDVRVPDGDLRADRSARLQRVGVRGPERGRPPRATSPSHDSNGRSRSSISRGVHPHSRETLRDARARAGTWRWSRRRCRTAPPQLPELGDDVAAVIVQQPNFLGAVEDLDALADAAHAAGALSDLRRAIPLPLALLKTPGECGVDIAVGEGQSLGNRLDFGGPSFGFFAATEALMRRIPGRIAGETKRRRRQARVRAHAADARAAHPPREGDLEHLHRAGAERARRRDLPELAGRARDRRAGRADAPAHGVRARPADRDRRRRRRCTTSRWCASSRSSSTRRSAR